MLKWHRLPHSESVVKPKVPKQTSIIFRRSGVDIYIRRQPGQPKAYTGWKRLVAPLDSDDLMWILALIYRLQQLLPYGHESSSIQLILEHFVGIRLYAPRSVHKPDKRPEHKK